MGSCRHPTLSGGERSSLPGEASRRRRLERAQRGFDGFALEFHGYLGDALPYPLTANGSDRREKSRDRPVLGEVDRAELADASIERGLCEHLDEGRCQTHPPPGRVDRDRHFRGTVLDGLVSRDGHAGAATFVGGGEREPAHIVQCGQSVDLLRSGTWSAAEEAAP